MSTLASGAGFHLTPRWGSVAREQLRTVGLAVRREMIAGLCILVALALPALAAHLRTPAPTSDLQFAGMMKIVVIVGVFGPIAVWKGEEPARRGYLWTQPVDRSRHSLLKVFGGWAWVMVAVAVFLLIVAGVAWLTGGELSLGETRVLRGALSPEATPTPADFFTHRWPVPAWLSVVPFVAATAMYLLCSIVVLSSSHPWRWFAGLLLGFIFLAALGEAGVGAGKWVARSFFEGRYGLEVLTTGSSSHMTRIAAPGGGQVLTLVHVPRPGAWATAAALWTGLGLGGVLVAARRYIEA
jgi:hypothetical protein